MPDALPLSEVELYLFTSTSATFWLTPHEFDVALGGAYYQRTPMARSEWVLGAEAAKSGLDLTLPPDHAVVHHLLASALTGEGTSLRLQIAQRYDNTDEWSLSGTRWVGRVLGVEVSDDQARIRAESAQVSLKRIGLRRLYSRRCAHVLYSKACGATPISAAARVSQSLGARIEFDDGVPALLRGSLAGGWLQTAQGSRHMIVEETANGVVLLTPAHLAVGTTVQLTLGCDHSLATCAARFNNLDNYGGFPAIPSKNPFSTGIF